jgi:hypothetical protein
LESSTENFDLKEPEEEDREIELFTMKKFRNQLEYSEYKKEVIEC